MTAQPETSKEQGQGQIPPAQISEPEISILQTPLNIEKGKKREAETTTPIGGSSEQQDVKRQKLTPLPEDESFQEISDSQGTEDSQQTDTGSGTGIQRQQSAEISSFKPPVKTAWDIKRTFTNIKARNDPLRLQVYSQYLKMAPKNQERLMSAYDIQQGKMLMSHLKPKVRQPQTAADYVRTNFEVLVKDIHPLDQIELHKQTGEMIYSTLTDKSMMTHKLQDSLDNTNTQLQLEKASSQAKDNRIKTLEEIIIGLGHNPKDVKGIEALIKRKDDDIAALRKQLKLPASRHPQTAEIIKQNSEEELMDLLLKLNEQLTATEKELENALKDKQANILVSTAGVVTGTTTTGQPAELSQSNTANLNTDELTKSMEDMKLQAIELHKTKEQLATLEHKYDLSKMSVADKTREVNKLEKTVKALEKDLTLEKPLKEINEILWDNIIQSIKDVWSSIQIMDEQNNLVKLALDEIERSRQELGNMPEEANRLIHFLNTQTKNQLAEIGIQDRTGTILEIKRVFTKRTLVQNLERRCSDMQEEIIAFRERLNILLNRGLPSPIVAEDKLMDLDSYVEKLDKYADNQASSSTSSSTAALPTGKNLHDRLENLFYLEHEVNHLFPNQPNFFRYTEADETLRKLQRTRVPEVQWWEEMMELL